MQKQKRKNLEAECLAVFDQVAREECVVEWYRGNGATNRYGAGFDLIGKQCFQYGDRRALLSDRIVVIEVESAGGVTNLAKYWPLARSLDRPLLLLHGFAQGSANDYKSHLCLWDFLWGKMRDELCSLRCPRMFARRFQYTHGNLAQLQSAATIFRDCLTVRPLSRILKTTFDYHPVATR